MFGHGVGPLLHEVAGVHVPPVLVGGEQADAHVHGSVTEWEDPAVSRKRGAVAVAHIEGALNPWVVMVGALEVGADRHALGPGAFAPAAQGAPESGVRTVGHHHVAGLHVAALPGCAVQHAHTPAEAAGQQRLGGLRPVPHQGPGPPGVVQHRGVQRAALHHVAVGGVDRVLRPGEFPGVPTGDGPQAAEAVVRLDLGAEAHVYELLDRPGGQAVAAGLVTRERLALHHEHIETLQRRPVGGGRAGWSTADDDQIVPVGDRQAPSPAARSGVRNPATSSGVTFSSKCSGSSRVPAASNSSTIGASVAAMSLSPWVIRS